MNVSGGEDHRNDQRCGKTCWCIGCNRFQSVKQRGKRIAADEAPRAGCHSKASLFTESIGTKFKAGYNEKNPCALKHDFKPVLFASRTRHRGMRRKGALHRNALHDAWRSRT